MKSGFELFLGTWNITEMSVWSQDSINLIGQAHFFFDDDGKMVGHVFIHSGEDSNFRAQQA